MHDRASRLLRISAPVELVTLAVLLVNLGVLHLPALASAVGPVHGCAYLIVIIAAARERSPDRTALALAAVPGIGGVLALRRLDALRAAAAPAARISGGAATPEGPAGRRDAPGRWAHGSGSGPGSAR
ncbi:DUF3817 domain-containing protein [Streptomyces sp. NRRL S-241]|uniref:DUF3817 domain-containing protein n=1 Tax=Streptomyces sp. NRRL S-241 TaxID=1463896 RepID=UPI001F27BCEF|nr:DUF3817 domain-containing protein [Streptomyces sp. NRRL S-241]